MPSLSMESSMPPKEVLNKQGDGDLVKENASQAKDNNEPAVTEKTSTDSPEYPYTVFNLREKYMIAIICGISGFWSAVSNNIYFPIIYTIENKFHVTEELANVSVVLYFLLQGIAPMFSASMADSIGRKPVVIFCCGVFVIACACIGDSNVYWLILVLRCVQAAGIAPVIAINSGICADLAPRSKRASLIGFTSGIQLLAQSIGALLGGVLASGFHSWRAIFWFLSIGGGVTMILSFFILPETKRSIVGNGSIPPKKFINKSPIWLVPHFKKKLTNDIETLELNTAQSLLSKLFDVPKIVTNIDVICVLIPASFYYTTWTMMFTSLSTTLQEVRGYSVLRVGLCFLAPGIAGTIGSFANGKILDWYYKKCHQKYREQLSEWEAKYGNDSSSSNSMIHDDTNVIPAKPQFSIFKVRLAMLFPCSILFISGLLIFSWCLEKNAPLAPVLIGTFLTSLVNAPYVGSSMNLLADMYPDKTSTGAACVNLSRCLMAACGVAALSRMQDAMGIGGCFTLMAGFCGLSLIPLWIVTCHGQRWLDERIEKERLAEEKKQDITEKV
ncbi:cation transporter [Saccharomycopsis crataegensis]|uniref:Cation transporter n=1 Tax=Saccharomycopsis crataegensis TaxID=43959 RepID=A0AAV5QE58_9ASCO|nr:cation transporter [Saccharomycopsis crataegensis]